MKINIPTYLMYEITNYFLVGRCRGELVGMNETIFFFFSKTV